MAATRRQSSFCQQRQLTLARKLFVTVLFLKCDFSATREGERAAARVPHLHSVDLPRSHGRDCPLTRSNEIILGELMLKMNHFLTIPWRRHRHISPGPCGWKPFILQHRAGRGLHSSQAKPRASPPALPPSKQKHMTERSHLIQSGPGRLQQQLSSKKY